VTRAHGPVSALVCIVSTYSNIVLTLLNRYVRYMTVVQ